MPWVLPQEAKKFFGNPIAGFKEVDDVLNTVSSLTQMLMGTVGLSDFNPVYDTGTNSGRYKLAVYIERNIPFWRGIRSAYVDINDNNKAYKAGKNVLGFIDTDKEQITDGVRYTPMVYECPCKHNKCENHNNCILTYRKF